MTLDDQRDTIERALGERMLNHCLTILRTWINEVGEQTYSNRYHSLNDNYQALFSYYLSTNDPERDRLLDEMTGQAYRLTDDIFADICLKRGRVENMAGFDRESSTSIMMYFMKCMRIQEEDLDWLCDAACDENQYTKALIAIASLVSNLKSFFQEDAILALIQCLDSDSEVIKQQVSASLLMLLIHYDVRIDFFPKVQDAFMDKIGDGEDMFALLCGFLQSTTVKLKDLMNSEHFDSEQIPTELKDLIQHVSDQTGGSDGNGIMNWTPSNDNEYIAGLIAILPQTWLYDALIGEDEERAEKLARAYLEGGMMDLMWNHLDEAETQLIEQLRSEHATPQDYINYGHICFIRGDRTMAYENYRQARQMIGAAKPFFALFRPDRGRLVDLGVPVEQVYLMEDNLIRV